jgi:hypothetical protein
VTGHAAPRRFRLVRDLDVVVAEGVVWTSGMVAIHRPDQPQSEATWVCSGLAELLASTSEGIQWIDPEPRAAWWSGVDRVPLDCGTSADVDSLGNAWERHDDPLTGP